MQLLFPVMAMASLASIQDLVVQGETRPILDKVSLDIQERDFITVIGPNGAGKSTLLKCLLGIVKSDSGSVTLSPQTRIGYVPQRCVVEPTMPLSSESFLKIGLKCEKPLWEETIEQVGISGLLRRPMHQMSGGEMQRILLTRALLREPNLLVLDEPAQNLDVSGQMSFYQMIDTQHREKGIAVIMVSHDLHLVMAATRRVICLNGHICCEGRAESVSRNPAFEALFGEQMAQLVRVYHHHHDHSHEPGKECDHHV